MARRLGKLGARLALTGMLAEAACVPPRQLQAPDPALAKEHPRVHIESDAPVTLRRRVAGAEYDVCDAPCDVAVPVDSYQGQPWQVGAPSDSFVVRGNFPDTDAFYLGRRGSEVRIDVKAGSSAGEALGYSATVLGATTAGFTLFMTFVFYALDGFQGDAFKPEVVGGLVGSHLGGVALLAVGIPLLVVSPTRVEILPAPSKTDARSPLTIHF